MAFRQIKSPALADKAVINTKLDESAVQGQSTLQGMVDPSTCFTLLYDVASDSLKKIGADQFFASFSTSDLVEGSNLYYTADRANADVAAQIDADVLVETQRAQAAETLLQNNIDAEASARAQADVTLQANITAEETRAKAREDSIEAAYIAADTALQSQLNNFINNVDSDSLDSLAEIVEAFQNADDALSASIIANATAITNEVNRAVAKETEINDRVTVEISRAQSAESSLAGLIGIEETARISGDNALSARLDTEETKSTSLQSQITAEVSRASGEESRIEGRLNSEITRATGAEAANASNISDEIVARAVADNQVRTDLGADIVAAEAAAKAHAESQDDTMIGDATVDGTSGNTVTDRIATAKAEAIIESSNSVAIENAARIAGDSDLNARVDQEIADRLAGDAANSAEVAAEQARAEGAEANLQSQVDFITSNTDPAALDSLTEIVDAFQSADSDMSALISSNTTAISNEASTRASADSTLQSNIDAEATTRSTADAGLQSQIDQINVDINISTQDVLDQAKAYTDQEADSHMAEAKQHADAQDTALIGDASVNGTGGNTITDRIATAKQQAVSHANAIVSTEEAARIAADTALSLRTTVLEGEMDAVETLSSQNETDLRAEEVARASGDSDLQAQVDALNANTTIDVDDLQTQITAEVNRASAAEGVNAASVVTERQRAEGVEAGLRADVNTNIGNISTNAGNITIEQAARIAGDHALTTRVDALEEGFTTVDSDLQSQIFSEVARASGAEAVLTATATDLQGQITDNDSDIAALQGLVGSDVQDLQDQIDAEVSRATTAEGVNAAAIAAEKTRAEGVEAGLRTDVDSNQSQITANDSDILALQILQASDHNDNQAQITAEVNRATAAEGFLQNNIDAEQARAEGIESGLRTDVDSVQAQVTANDSDILALQSLQAGDVTDLQNQLNSEITRATSIEGGLRTDVDTVTGRVDAIIGTSPETLDTLQEIVQAFEDADSDLQGVISSNGGRLTTLESEMDAVEVRATDLEALTTVHGTRLNGIDSDQVVQNSRLNTAESDIDALEAKQGSSLLHTTATNVSDAINELHAEIDGEAADLTALENRVTTEEANVDALQGDMSAVEARATALEGRATVNEGDIDDLEAKVGTASLATVATDLSAAINELHAELDVEVGDLTSLEGRVTTAEGEIDTLQSEMDAVEGRATSLESRMTTEEGHVDVLQGQMGSQVLTTTASTVTAAVNELHAQTDVDEGRISTLEGEMDAVEGRATSLEGRATALETEQTLQAGRLTVNEADIDALESKIGVGPFDTTAQTVNGAVNEVHGELDAVEGRMTAAESRADADSDALVQEIADRVSGDLSIRADFASYRTTDQADYIARDAVVLASAQTYAEAEADDAEAAAKTYADGIVANEAALRSGADATLQGNIDAEATARQIADNGLDSRLTVVETEMTATQLAAGVNADGTYITPTGSNYIDASTSLSDAAAKLDAAIKAVDNSHNGNKGNLQSQIDAEIARATAAETANTTLINNEVARATGAESDLGELITTNAQAIASEASRAQGVESSLQSQIDFVVSNTDSAALDSLTEIVAALQSGDGDLLSLIQTNQTDIATNTTGLAQEITDRAAQGAAIRGEFAAADANLQTQIDGKVAKSGDTMSGSLSMGGNKVTSVANGTDPQDAVNKGQLDAGLAAQHISQFSTTDVTEGDNLYFTTARARASVSAVDTAGEGKVSYDPSTGAFSVDTAKSILELVDVADSSYDGKNGYVLRVTNTLDGMSLQDPTQLAFNNAKRQTMAGDGAQTTFALDFYTQDQNAIVFVGGVIQDPGVHYNIDAVNQLITFNAAIPVGTQAVVIAQSTNSVGVLDPKSVGLETLADNIKVFEQGNDIIAGTSATVVSSFNKSQYRSAKYVVTVESGGEFETREALVVHDGSSAYIVEYGVVFTGSSFLGDTDVQVNGESIELLYTAESAGAVVSVSVTYVDA